MEDGLRIRTRTKRSVDTDARTHMFVFLPNVCVRVCVCRTARVPRNRIVATRRSFSSSDSRAYDEFKRALVRPNVLYVDDDVSKEFALVNA